MLKKLTLVGTALAMTAAAIVPAAPAMAQSRGYNSGYGQNYRSYDNSYRGYDRSYRDNRRSTRRDKCNDGDGGTIVGAIAGGLLGNTIAGRGDKTVGTILGGAVGALAGRSIDRSDRPGYCRR